MMNSDVGMIQIGNEINYGMSGEPRLENVITLLKAGSKAIREVSADYTMAVAPGIIRHSLILTATRWNLSTYLST